jgi:hypothetical protein
MNVRTIAYIATTGLFTLALTGSGLASLLYVDGMAENMTHLGYGEHFTRLLGSWKLLGVLALVVPALPRLKEWAYAGFFFNLTGAAIAHASAGDGVGEIAAPLVLLAIAGASYALRDASRRLPAVVVVEQPQPVAPPVTRPAIAA